MKISMYALSHDVFRKSLGQLQHVMEKGIANAKARSFDTSVLVGARLAPDMLPFSKQIQLTSDFAKNSMARLAGIDPPKFEDNETTIAELIARVDKTIDYLQSFKPEQLDGSDERTITIPTPRQTFTFPGLLFLRHWALPNFFFHVTTAYNLLRHNGVEIGKADYLGRVS